MANSLTKIGFGGGCHWCTEAVFQTLKGVFKVEQGWIGSADEHKSLSEAVIVHFNELDIPLHVLIEVHLLTHNSRSNHSMRKKYRSAIYTFDKSQEQQSKTILKSLQTRSYKKIVTEVYPFKIFSPSHQQIQNYYKKNPSKPFCVKYIDPKLQLIAKQFSKHLNPKTVS